jgi:flagellar assembly protein FliH
VALQVRVHPDDVVAIGDVEALAPSRSIVLLADPSVDRGGCVVDAGPCEIVAMIGAALERVREVLVDGR